MNAILNEKEEKQDEVPVTVETALPDDARVLTAWKALSDLYAGRPRLASTLANTKVEVGEKDNVKIVDFQVFNASQKQWIEDKLLRDMEGNLRKLLSCNRVNIVVSVVPEEEQTEKVPYMPEEKAKDLIAKNQDVREFVALMGLDTK